MSRTCKICGCSRANEKFGGKGLRKVICNQCRKLPAETKMSSLWIDEILGFLDQKNISAKNIKRLMELEAKGIDRVTGLVRIVRQIAEVHPFKRRRWARLRFRHRKLYLQAVELGLCEDRSLSMFYGPNDDLSNVWIESEYENYPAATFDPDQNYFGVIESLSPEYVDASSYPLP